MKKILLLLLFCFSFIWGNAQTSNKYYSDFFEESFRIGATTPEKGEFTFFIYCKFKNNQVGGLAVDSKDMKEFVKSLNLVKKKYNEWSRVAKKNNIVDYAKNFDVVFPSSLDGFFDYGRESWHYNLNLKLEPYFRVTKDGKYLVAFKSGKLKSVESKFVSVDGFDLVFASTNEIDDFIKALDVDAVVKESNEKAAVNNLFK